MTPLHIMLALHYNSQKGGTQAQNWYLSTAWGRLKRRELALAMGWIFNHIEHAAPIFEVGCGSGNNLVWLARHGYTRLGGSDMDDKALAVARGMADSLHASWRLERGDLLAPEHMPPDTAVLLAVNCSLYLDDFLRRAFARLPEDGYVVIDQTDASFNTAPDNQYHTSTWKLPLEQRRPSQYKARYAMTEVRAIAEKLGLRILRAMPSFQVVPRVVYIFGRGAEPLPRYPIAPQRIDESRVQTDITTIFQSGLFDWNWYREQYVRGPEIMDPLEHYVRFGAAKGYWPNASFDTNAYRNRHMEPSDPANPLAHHITCGGDYSC